jgi:Putative lumazine-binding
MIDISINKTLALLTGLYVSGLPMVDFASRNNMDSGDPARHVREIVELFVKAGDERNISQLDSLLHEQFRVIANQLLGSSAVSLISKDQYLKLIGDGKLGGDRRTIRIESIDIIGKNAAVKVHLKGDKLTFQSFYHLIQSPDDKWQIVQDLPFASKN